MPFALNHKRYMMRMQPTDAAGSTVSMMWSCYDREFCEDLDTMTAPDEAVGRDYHVMFKFAVGPATKDQHGERRNARISAYVCPTPEDVEDATYIGMCIDENNEAELVKGVPTIFHLKSIQAPREDRTRHMVFPGMTFFVEWSKLDDREVSFSPLVPAPLAYMQILERTGDILCSHRLATVMKDYTNKDAEGAPVPAAPAPRTKPPSSLRKRGREGEQAPAPVPAPSPAISPVPMELRANTFGRGGMRRAS